MIKHPDGSTLEVEVSACTVDTAKRFAAASWLLHCGKCTFGREGSFQLKQILDDLTTGRANTADISQMTELCEAMKINSYCEFGKDTAVWLINLLTDNREEFHNHALKRCGQLVCTKYVNLYIKPEKCTGCNACLEVCDEDAIEGDEDEIHIISPKDCTKCGKCLKVCGQEAIGTYGSIRPPGPRKPVPVGTWKK